MARIDLGSVVGRGITSITKTGTNGNIDTYTIQYNDNTSSTFTITNGTQIDIIDNLTSDSTTNALSANQGKELKKMIDACASNMFFTVAFPGSGEIELIGEAKKGWTWNDFIANDTTGKWSSTGSRILYDVWEIWVDVFQSNYFPVKGTDLIGPCLYVLQTCCFEEGTQVLVSLDGTTKNIENIQKGDQVVSYNTDTDELFETTVISTHINPMVTDVAIVTLENGDFVRMNAYHPILTTDGYHSITQYDNLPVLSEGDMVITKNGASKIITIDRTTQEIESMYNLGVVNEYHNYIANNMVVHNAACIF